jgi:hypothetical protein
MDKMFEYTRLRVCLVQSREADYGVFHAIRTLTPVKRFMLLHTTPEAYFELSKHRSLDCSTSLGKMLCYDQPCCN